MTKPCTKLFHVLQKRIWPDIFPQYKYKNLKRYSINSVYVACLCVVIFQADMAWKDGRLLIIAGFAILESEGLLSNFFAENNLDGSKSSKLELENRKIVGGE
jgi:hypothetical protein